jgi:HEAT repeat protein
MPLVRSSRPDPDAAANVADRGYEVLVAELWDAESRIRRAAVRDLGALPAGGPDPAMALCDRLDVETSPSVRSVIMTLLIQLGTPKIAARLSEHLHSEDARLRNAAIEALQEMPQAVGPLLDRLLADEDSDVRIFAVNILATLQHDRAPEWLALVVRTDPHVNVCVAALDGLVEVGGVETISDIEELGARFAENAFVRFAVDAAIRRIRGA